MALNFKKDIAPFLGLIVLWQVISMSGLVNPMFLSSPLETAKEGAKLFAEGKIFVDLGYSFFRILYGFLLAFLIGVPLGLFLGYYGRIYGYLESLIDFFRSIPPILIFPVALLIFGIGEQSRIAVIFFGCVSIMILNSSLGVIYSRKVRINAARIMGARWYQIISRIVIFDALPQIFVGIRVSLSMGIIIGIVTEMLVGAKYGLGSRVVYAQTAYATPELYFTIILVGLMGFAANRLLIAFENRVVHWKYAA
ncbi:MAG: ABC transporter permease [Candidatus Omnitrophota bacterium]|jgi:NitT/TauT family transport system permease protein